MYLEDTMSNLPARRYKDIPSDRACKKLSEELSDEIVIYRINKEQNAK